MKILYLTLYKKWFDQIKSGFKTEEYRGKTPYWIKRLRGKTFDEVHFRNGYGRNAPLLKVKCLDIEEDTEVFIIKLGEITN